MSQVHIDTCKCIFSSLITRGQYWPSGIVVACVCPSVRPSVHKFVRAITHHPFKLGSPNLDHRCKRPWLKSLLFWEVIDLWPSGSNLTLKSKLTPFWACPTHYSSPIQVRISKFGPQMHFSTVKIPVNSKLDWPWTSLSFLIPKIICLNCGGVHWDCETVPGLFQCCSVTVSQSQHQCTWRMHSQCGMGTLLLKLNKIIT